MTIYDFTVRQSNGKRIPLYQYEGKPVLIMNTASKCKFTSQFSELQSLYDQYHEAGVEFLGFPCNQFGGQEPGSNEEAASFCQINYGVKFPMLAKVDVNGESAHPLFDYLKKAAPFKGFDESNINEKLLKLMITDMNPEWLHGDSIKWNFTKFLIDRQGQVVARFEPADDIDKIAASIEQQLSL
ncbi:glutathione peroxidase [Paenibacillus xylaniclasticus]|uniref:glutathione peroxidase n=1 Tax=Paenibacillus xylaniclasticus TaxID=588083 RepID=UPI000FD8DB7B|nr:MULTISPECIES: glutathione peroxidase [Paenibacillus]GFN34099.1 glutathione peroxidase [Paenibacillus curdlanolyticus]